MGALFAAATAPGAFAQAPAYPTKPVRIVVPFAAGGGVDVTARILAQKLTERAGQSFIVDNRTGASGMIGCELVAKSAPDGYTLLVGSQTTHAVVPALYSGKIGYDAVRDFAPVTVIATSPMLIVLHRYLFAPHAKHLGCQRLGREQNSRLGLQKSQSIAKLPYGKVAVPLAKDSSLHHDVAPPAQARKEQHGAAGNGCRTEDLGSQGRHRRLRDRWNQAKDQKGSQHGQRRTEQ